MQSNINIHLASIQDLFSEYGIRNISMDDIARSLHISKKTIYKQYSCKDELVNDIYMSDYYRFKAILHSLERENSDAISKTIQLYNILFIKILSIKTCVHFDLEKYYPDLLNEITDLHRESIKKTLIEILFAGKADNYFNKNINPYSAAHLFKLLIESYVLDQISKSEEGYILSCDDVFDYHFRSICNPIGLRKWEVLKTWDSVSEQP
ncbi:MAG: TetR/AcrR family transcriptional regulator [Prolixibacteraceae bacterium]|nr:TetR/AcrR family transcriptional regulator [Prolixibacteraceae bacterium]